MNSIVDSIKKKHNKTISYKDVESDFDVVLGSDPNIIPTPHYIVETDEKIEEKTMKSISAPVWDEWQNGYYPCVRVRFHCRYEEESWYLKDILDKPYGQLYLQY